MEIALQINLTLNETTNSGCNPKYDFVKRHEQLKLYLDSLTDKLIIGHDAESNVNFNGTGNALSLLQYAIGDYDLIVCFLSYENCKVQDHMSLGKFT